MLEMIRLLLSVLWVVVNALVIQYDRRPFGPRMCDQFCRQTGECSVYMYSVENLICRVGNKMYQQVSTMDGSKLYNISKENRTHFSLACRKYTRAVTDKEHHPKCVNSRRYGHRTKMRLLISHRRFRNLSYVLENTSIKEYPLVSTKSVRALVYISRTRHIAMATDEKRIISLPLGSSNSMMCFSWNSTITCMCADQVQELLFLCTASREAREIIRMEPDCTNVVTIFTLTRNHWCISIVADPVHNILYASTTWNDIISVTYRGMNYKRLTESENVPVYLAFDESRNVLFFAVGKYITKWFLSSSEHTNKETVRLSENIRTVFYHDNHIYVGFNHTKYIAEINIMKMRPIKIHIPRIIQSRDTFLLCAIP